MNAHDAIAIEAMLGILRSGSLKSGVTPNQLASDAYAIADAMVREHDERFPNEPLEGPLRR